MVAASAIGLCAVVDWALVGHARPYAGVSQFGTVTFDAHSSRSITASVNTTFSNTGNSQVTVHESVGMAQSDPLAPLVENGEVQHDLYAFDGLFGVYVSTPDIGLTTSPVSTVSTATGITSSASMTWTLPAGTQSIALRWAPIAEKGDIATLTLSITGGFVAGISGEQPTQRGATSAQFNASSITGEPDLVLAANNARISSVPQAGDLGNGSGWVGLGSATLSTFDALWACGIAYPAFMVFRRRRNRPGSAENAPAAAIAAAGAWAAASVAASGLFPISQSRPWMITLLPMATLALYGPMPRFRLRALMMNWADAAVILSLCGGCIAVVLLPDATTDPAVAFCVTFLCLIASALLAAVSPTYGAKLSTILVPIVIVLSLVGMPTSFENPTRDSVEYWLANAALPSALFAVSVAAMTWPLLGARHAWRRRRRVLLVIAGLSGIPVLTQLASNSSSPSWTDSTHVDLMTVAAVTALLGFVLLAGSGRYPSGVADTGARWGAIAVIAIACAGYGWVSDAWAGFDALLTVAAVRILIPRSTVADGLVLAAVDRHSHARYVHRLRTVRTIAAAERQFHRDSVAAIAQTTGDRLSVEEYESRSRDFQRRAAGSDDQGLIDRGLGTLAGSTPWESALAGLGYGTLVGLPLMAEIFVRTNVSSLSVFQAGSVLALAVVALHTARWLIYGAVYGYFYTRLRGKTAYAKAIWFAAILSVPELAASWPTYTSQPVAVGSAVVVLRLFAFAAVLATLWEMRQARRAETGWDTVRNLRSVRALAAPGSAIVLALVTALATTFANTEIPQLISPQQSQPSVSSPAHPN